MGFETSLAALSSASQSQGEAHTNTLPVSDQLLCYMVLRYKFNTNFLSDGRCYKVKKGKKCFFPCSWETS